MRIAFVCKRRYTGKDVIGDRFGRLYEIPRQLAMRGHEVTCLCIEYQRGGQDGSWEHDAGPGLLEWRSRSLGMLRIPRLAQYPMHLLSALRSLKPDLVIGASDIPNVGLARWAAGRIGVPCVTDLYDDFTSFGQARIPGARKVLGDAVSGSDLVFVVSDPLRRIVIESWNPRSEVVVVPNAVDSGIFHSVDKASARAKLGLPLSGRLFGTAGGLYRSKGIEALYSAWEKVKIADSEAHLVLAGPFHPSLPPIEGERIHYLGSIPHADVCLLINALDVAVATVEDNAFGRSCFPQKAYEILACGTPIAAADIGSISTLLSAHPESLYQAGSAESLAACVLRQFKTRVVPAVPVFQWSEVGAIVDDWLARIIRA